MYGTRGFLIILILFINSELLFAQKESGFPFKINGTIDADTGTVRLGLIGDSSLYPKNLRHLSAKVENKKFAIEGMIPYPQGFQLLYGKGYYTDLAVVQAGVQKINIRLNSKVPEADNLIMIIDSKELKEESKHSSQKRSLLEKKWDSLEVVYKKDIPKNIQLELEKEMNECYRESDQSLLRYTIKHPNSYLAFWKLVGLLPFGYYPVFDSIYTNLSDSIKNSYAGKAYYQKLKAARTFGTGKAFPSIPIVDRQNKKIETTSLINNKYTLIDFWYSNCGPCLAQFPVLKKIYEDYKNKGFEIVAISTDKRINKQKWLNTISKNKLLWGQYWDVDGVESLKLAITAFPTNFLIDRDGKIIRMNLRPLEVEDFLKNQL